MSSRTDAPTGAFRKPARVILNQTDMPRFLKSQGYSTLMDFILRVNEKVKKRKVRTQRRCSLLTL